MMHVFRHKEDSFLKFLTDDKTILGPNTVDSQNTQWDIERDWNSQSFNTEDGLAITKGFEAGTVCWNMNAFQDVQYDCSL